MLLAKNNPKRIFSYIIASIIVSLFILVSSNICEARESARDKACFSNMRVILGALEMYNMDNEVMMDDINDYYIDLLIKGKYLKSKPSYPERQCKYEGHNICNGGEIFCHYHGSFETHMANGQLAPYWEEQKQAARKQRRETLYYITLIIAIIIAVGFLFDHSKNKNIQTNDNSI